MRISAVLMFVRMELKDFVRAVLRKNSRSLRYQAILMVKSTENRVSYNLEVVRNDMPMFVWCDWKSAGWNWNSRAEAGMGTDLIIMGDPALQKQRNRNVAATTIEKLQASMAAA